MQEQILNLRGFFVKKRASEESSSTVVLFRKILTKPGKKTIIKAQKDEADNGQAR